MRKALSLLVALTASAWAQDALSLSDAVGIALKNNKALERAAASKDAAISRVTQAHSGFLPKANYSESWTRSDNPVFVFSSLLTQHQFGEQNFQIGPLNQPDYLNNFQSQITADQPIYDAGKTKRAVHSADLGRQVTEEDARKARLDVIANVVRSYSDVLLSVEQLEAARQAISSAQSDLDRTQNRLTAGTATDADVLSVQVRLAEVREQEVRRSADLDVARAALNDALGLPLDTAHTLTTMLTPVPMPSEALADYESQGASSRPEARQRKLDVDLAETQAKDARGNLLPEVSAHAAFEADRQRFYNRGGDNWLVSIGLRWNLFNGFGDKARIAETQSSVRRSKAEQESADSAIRLQVRRAYADLRAAQQRIEVEQASVAQAQESLRVTQNRYEAGLSTVTDLLRTESALLDTRTRYLAAVHDQRVAAAMLEWAAGTLSPDSEALKQ